MSKIPVSVTNETLINALRSDDPNMHKKAQVALNEVTRTQLREGSFTFQILPPEQIGPEDLDRDLTAVNRVICELEVDSPGASWVPLQGVPEGEYITDSRYQVIFSNVVTPKFVKDIRELYSVKQDVRKVLTENALKDGLTKIDGKFISKVDAICMDIGTTPVTVSWGTNKGTGYVNQFTKKVQYVDFTTPFGGATGVDTTMSRVNVLDAMRMLITGNAGGKFRLANHIILMNDATRQEIMKWDRNSYGDDEVGKFVREGLTHDTLFGVKTIATIKDELVPNGVLYFFAAPEFLGRCLYLDDWTTWMKKEAWFISMFSWWYGGISIGNLAGVAKVKFDM